VLAAFWAVVWMQSADSALTRVPVLDEAWYLREAARIRDDGIVGRPFVMSPLYPIAAAVLGAGRALPGGVLEGGHPWALLAVQAAAWMAIGALIFTTVRERAGAGRAGGVIALAAALLFWLYRPAAVYARTILLEIPLALTVTTYLVLLTRWRVRTPRRPLVVLLAAGLSLGLATLLRAHVLALLVPGVLVVAGRTRTRRWTTTAPIAVLMGAALLPVVLAAAHNTAACGRPAGPVLNGGINLYLGNATTSRGLFVTPAGLDLEREPAGQGYLAGRFHRDDLDVCEADRLWFAEALREVRAHPGEAAAGWLRKVWLHAQGWEISQVTPLGAWAREVPVLRALWVPYGLLTVLGLAGLAAALGRGRTGDDLAVAALWGGSLVLLVALQSLVFVVSRYRLVLVPPLCVLAGLGALHLRPLLAARRWRAARLPAAVALAAVIAGVPWGLGETRRLWAALETQNEALRWERWAAAQPAVSGRAWPRAQRLYGDLIAAQPERGEAYLGLARVFLAAGEVSGASDVLAGGLVRADRPEPLQRELVSLLLRQQRWSEVRVQLESFLREHPQDADMLHNLTVLLGKTGRWEQAHEVAYRLRAAAPGDARSYLDLAAVEAALGRRDDAVAILLEGLGRLPGHPELAATLERVRARP
jgi:4-amino-4-deoxy-L-arabinose transferase-like glycosyltransferase